jgi:dipeptidyl aminopeptidase/acylaminoacyl peptidase
MRKATILFALISLCAAGVASAEIPIARFTNYPKIETLTISPGGKYLALTHRTSEREMLSVLRYPDLELAASSHFGDLIDIDSLWWFDDRRLLVQPARRFYGFRVYKVPTGEIIAVDVDKRSSDLVFGYRAGKAQTGHLIHQRQSTLAWASIIDIPPDVPDSILIQTGSYDREGSENAVQRLNIKNGTLSRIAGSPVQQASYVTDAKHQVLFVSGWTEKGEMQTHQFDPVARSWRLVTSSGQSEGRIWPFEDTSTPGEYLALDSTSTSADQLVAWKPANNEKRVLFQKEGLDVGIEGADANGRVWAFSYDDHYPEYWYPDVEHPLARAHRALRAAFKDANVHITSQTRDMSLAVVVVSAPAIPPTFYLVDVGNVKLLQKLSAYPDLKPEDLSPTDPVEIVVRDGMKIRGYLTTPRGSKGKGLPLIMMVHGGPHGIQDRYDYEPEVQLFASRGYAVLRVNFRGSGGRGRDFETAGYGRWGREMQDDITDSVKWAIASGIADRERICIYGGSYGAYSALTGAFREPALFKCAIGVAGVYDLPLLFDKGDIRLLERGVRYLHAAVGTDMEELRRRSPVNNADKIKVPVMLIHGKDDERAPFEHARRMREALIKAGNPPEWLTEAAEGHGFGGEANRVEMYERVLAFLAKHLDRSAPRVAGQ